MFSSNSFVRSFIDIFKDKNADSIDFSSINEICIYHGLDHYSIYSDLIEESISKNENLRNQAIHLDSTR